MPLATDFNTVLAWADSNDSTSDSSKFDVIKAIQTGQIASGAYGNDWTGVDATFPSTPDDSKWLFRRNTDRSETRLYTYDDDAAEWIFVEIDRVSDYFTEVALGNIPGSTAIEKFGRNDDIDIGTEDIWSNGGEWEPFTNGEQTCNIVSTSTNDDGDPVGTGARTIEITGISSGVITTETITMNGVTNVVTSNAYTIIYRMEVLTVGVTGSNVGLISATGTTDTGETISCIAATHNQTRMAIVQVPTNAKGTMYDYYLTINTATPATTIITLELKEKKSGANTPWVTKHIEVFNSDGDTHIHHDFETTKLISAGSYAKLSITTSKDNTDISGGFGIIMTDN